MLDPTKDPVLVFGRSDVEPRPWGPERCTYLNIPGTECHVHEINAPPDEYRNAVSITHDIACPVRSLEFTAHWIPWRFEGIVMASMAVERDHLVSMIDRCIAALGRRAFFENAPKHPIHVSLWNWKMDLVLEKLRRNAAARSIQARFKKSVSDPKYDMCKRRLAREFAGLAGIRRPIP